MLRQGGESMKGMGISNKRATQQHNLHLFLTIYLILLALFARFFRCFLVHSKVTATTLSYCDLQMHKLTQLLLLLRLFIVVPLVVVVVFASLAYDSATLSY